MKQPTDRANRRGRLLPPRRTPLQAFPVLLLLAALGSMLGSMVGGAPIAAEPPPSNPQLERADYRATGLVGHPPLRQGTVVDLTFGRRRGAIEWHRVRGAAADTTYQVVGEVFLATACAVDDPTGPISVPEGDLVTDQRGDGSLVMRFPGESFAEAPDRFWVRWSMTVDGTAAHRTRCVEIELGP